MAAATRELTEESGLTDVTLVSADPFDLDVQALGTRFGQCRTHFDLLYAGRARRSARPSLNHESDAIDWFPVDALPGAAAAGLAQRVARTRRAILDRGI